MPSCESQPKKYSLSDSSTSLLIAAISFMVGLFALVVDVGIASLNAQKTHLG